MTNPTIAMYESNDARHLSAGGKVDGWHEFYASKAGDDAYVVFCRDRMGAVGLASYDLGTLTNLTKSAVDLIPREHVGDAYLSIRSNGRSAIITAWQRNPDAGQRLFGERVAQPSYFEVGQMNDVPVLTREAALSLLRLNAQKILSSGCELHEPRAPHEEYTAIPMLPASIRKLGKELPKPVPAA